MRIDDCRENVDGGKWTVRGGNLTWGNSELKMGDHHNLLATRFDMHEIATVLNFLNPACREHYQTWFKPSFAFNFGWVLEKPQKSRVQTIAQKTWLLNNGSHFWMIVREFISIGSSLSKHSV